MARGTVYQVVQIGVESTRGTIVPATQRLLNFSLDPTPMIPIKPVKYPGSKANIMTLRGQEHTEAKFSATWDFNTLAYAFTSMFGNPTITTPGVLSRQRLWSVSPTNPLLPNTYTFEQGSSKGAEKFGFGFFNEIGLKWTKEDAVLDGSIIGQQTVRNAIMTGSVPSLAVNPVQPLNIGVFISTDGGNNFTQLSKNLEGDFKFGALYKPVFHVSDLNASFDDVVEQQPGFQLTLTTEEGSEADTFMSNLYNGQAVYIGIKAQGGLIENVSSINYYNLLKVQMPCFVTKPQPGDKNGVWGNTFTFDVAHDDTFGMVKALLINSLAAL